MTHRGQRGQHRGPVPDERQGPFNLYGWFHGVGHAHVYRRRNGICDLWSACGVERLETDKVGHGERGRCNSCRRVARHWVTDVERTAGP